MNATFARWILFTVSILFTGPATSERLIVYSPDPLIGEFIQSHAPVRLFIKRFFEDSCGADSKNKIS